MRPGSQGAPYAPRPIITPSAPERASASQASCGVVMSPLTTTGMATASLTSRTRDQSAVPLKKQQRVRPCTVTMRTPAASARRASSGALSDRVSQPRRILRVTGTRDGGDDGFDQRQRVVEVAHQCAAGELAGHLTCRAAHIDVDDVGAARLGDSRALGHPLSFAAGELYDEWYCAAAVDLAHDLQALVGQVFAGDHLGHDQAGAQRLGGIAHGQVADAGHGRQQGGVWQADRADRQRPRRARG